MSIVGTASAVPHGRLAGLASRYVGYRLEGFESGTHLGLPSCSVVVVISLGTPIRVTIDGRSADHAAFAAGLDTRPAAISHDGNQYGVMIDLTPAGARSLLGVPAEALAGTTADLDQLLGRHTGEAIERMATAPTWRHRFDILDQALCHRVERLAPARDYLDHAWHHIVTSAGAARISDLATDIGFSGRYLRRRFAAEFGLTPKSAARVVRFDRSRWMLQSPVRPSLATVAATCGYYDQAHLARDWNELAGCPPSAWLPADAFPLTEIQYR